MPVPDHSVSMHGSCFGSNGENWRFASSFTNIAYEGGKYSQIPRRLTNTWFMVAMLADAPPRDPGGIGIPRS